MGSERTVIEFDHHSAIYGATAIEVDGRIRSETPVAWTQSHGGYWLVTSYEHATTVLRDWATFSNAKSFDKDGEPCGGVMIPPIPEITAYPDEVDPPLWGDYRRPVSRLFAPAAINQLLERIQQLTTDFIDRVIEAGQTDLAMDIASPVPAAIILEIMGLPLEDWKLYAVPFHEIAYAAVGSPVYERAQAGLELIGSKLAEAISERRANPGDDFIGNVIRARPQGQELDDMTIQGICMDSLGGGVDTTTAMLANAFVYLDEHRAERDRLRGDPQLVRLATEEFLRWVAPIRMLARTATRDVVLDGQPIRAGDRILVSFSAANRDETVFEDPDTVILDRFPNKHAGFGIGIHRCLGSNLARVVFQNVLQEVLRRMPDYEIDWSRAEKYQTMSIVNGWVTVPARFTPGMKEGVTTGSE